MNNRKLLQATIIISVLLVSTMVGLQDRLVYSASGASLAQENSWVSLAPIQVPRIGLGVATVKGKIYAIGGATAPSRDTPPTSGFTNANEEYNPTTNTWTFKTPMPTARYGFGIAAIQNKIYCIGGCYANSVQYGPPLYTGVNEVYDPSKDTWETKASMPNPRLGTQANAVNDKIYIIGGSGNLTQEYDPATDSWVTKAPMPIGADSFASTVIDDKIFVTGGIQIVASLYSERTQIYDPANDSWSTVPTPPSPSIVVGGAAGATTGKFAPSRVYVIGIFTGIYPEEEVGNQWLTRVYDPKNGSWSLGATFPTQRAHFGLAMLNDTLYVIGGETVLNGLYPKSSAVNEQYYPVGYGAVPPIVSVLSPKNGSIFGSLLVNGTFPDVSIPLTYTANKPLSWIGYSLNGDSNVTISQNTTIVQDPTLKFSNNFTLYANDTLGNWATPQTVHYDTAINLDPLPIPTLSPLPSLTQEPTPTPKSTGFLGTPLPLEYGYAIIAAAIIAVIAVTAITLRRKKRQA
jgi:N-acetylneuraminic acid mutarotase